MSPAEAGKAVVWAVLVITAFGLYLWLAVSVGQWLHRLDVERQFRAHLERERLDRCRRLALLVTVAEEIEKGRPDYQKKLYRDEAEAFHLDSPQPPRAA